MDFLPEFENVYRGLGQSAADRILTRAGDRRARIPGDLNCPWFKNEYADIGLLRMVFNGKVFVGTATLIAGGECLLTCAHNLIDHDPITKKFKKADVVWFEIRNNNQEDGSTLIKRYNVKNRVVHPSYFKNPETSSGFDLALCWIDVPEDDNTLKNGSYNCLSNPVVEANVNTIASVVGFPCEREGEKWGMVGSVNILDDETTRQHNEILMYEEIDTTEGQSGSPVMLDSSKKIIGVHTGGNLVKGVNWATLITTDKLRWIEEQIRSSRQ